MNIALLIPSLIYCGPINVVLGIVKNITNIDEFTKFTIVCIENHVDKSLVKSIENENLAEIVFLSEIKLELEQFFSKFDVVHSHGFYPDKLLASLRISIKKISTIHCMFYKDYPKEYGFLKGYLGAFIHMRNLKKGNFDHIICCSKSVADYVFLNTKLKNLFFINNGVDQSLFFPLDPVSKNKRLNEVGFHNYKRIFVYSGRLIRRKRVPELINFFVNNANSDDLLIVLGEGEEFDDCKKIAKNNIIFLGHVNNPEYYYQISDFIISNSSAEGYPMSILEAASCGCFAILSNIKPHVEFVENNPDISELLNNFNFNDVVEINSNYSFSELSSLSMAKKYLDFYKKV